MEKSCGDVASDIAGFKMKKASSKLFFSKELLTSLKEAPHCATPDLPLPSLVRWKSERSCQSPWDSLGLDRQGNLLFKGSLLWSRVEQREDREGSRADRQSTGILVHNSLNLPWNAGSFRAGTHRIYSPSPRSVSRHGRLSVNINGLRLIPVSWGTGTYLRLGQPLCG